MVITQWNWGNKFTYAHDEIATDRDNPRVNSNGPVYGVDIGNDNLLRRPGKNTDRADQDADRRRVQHPVVRPDVPGLQHGRPGPNGFGSLGCPARGRREAFPGAYENPANPHNPMMDATGPRVDDDARSGGSSADGHAGFCRADP